MTEINKLVCSLAYIELLWVHTGSLESMKEDVAENNPSLASWVLSRLSKCIYYFMCTKAWTNCSMTLLIEIYKEYAKYPGEN